METKSNWRLAFGRIASIAIFAGGWLFAGVRLVLDLIGYATAPEDARVASGLLHAFFLWVLSLPWWIPWGFALASTFWLTWVSWPRDRHVSSEPRPDLIARVQERTFAISRGLSYDLAGGS